MNEVAWSDVKPFELRYPLSRQIDHVWAASSSNGVARRQTSGQNLDLNHVQLLCNIQAVHDATENHYQ